MTIPQNENKEYALKKAGICFPPLTRITIHKMRSTAENRIPLTGEAALVETDSAGFITVWSRPAEILFGFEDQEIIGMHISILYSAGDLAHGKAAYELSAACSRGAYCASGWQVRKNGQHFWSYSESKKTEEGYQMMIMEIPCSNI
jgi:PAS domain S-box-containing protein